MHLKQEDSQCAPPGLQTGMSCCHDVHDRPLQAAETLEGIFQPAQATSDSGHQLGQMLYFMTVESRRTIIGRHIDEPEFFPCR